MIVQTFYAGLNFSSRNLLDLAAGGTFMSLTLGAAMKLLDNMMVNYSEWHTERAPQGKKVNYVEETCHGFVNRSAIGVGVWQFVEGGEHGRAIWDGGSMSLPSFRSRNGGETLRAAIIHYMATSARLQ
jgi:hypothetical protein